MKKGKSAREAAIEVLEKAGEPLATKEIIERVLATDGVKLPGKTPGATVAKVLSLSNAKGGPIKRTAPGTYALREQKAEQSSTADADLHEAAATQKREAKADPKPSSRKRTKANA